MAQVPEIFALEHCTADILCDVQWVTNSYRVIFEPQRLF